jgi:Mrp family chromosome partitioning ATPase
VRYFRTILVCFGIGIACASLYILTVTPTFTASVQILLNRPNLNGDPTIARLQAQLALDASQIETQIETLRSEEVLGAVVDALDLSARPEFQLRTSFAQWFRSLLTDPAPQADVDTSVPATAESDQAVKSAAALAYLNGGLNIRRIGQSTIIELAFRSSSPQTAAQVSNAIAAAYIRNQLRAKLRLATWDEWLQQRIRDLESQEAQAQEALNTGSLPTGGFPAADARIITAASVPFAKSAPPVRLLIAAGAIFGLAAGIVIAVVRHGLDRTIRAPEQVRDATYLPTFGVLPRCKFAKSPYPDQLPSARHSFSPFSDGVRRIKTALDTSPGGKPRVIGVSGLANNVGATTVSISLAKAFAARDTSVLLIDADIRHRDLSHRAQREMLPGLLDGLESSSNLRDLVVRGLFEDADFMPAGRTSDGEVPNSGDLLGSSSMKSLLETLPYEVIVIDLPPISELPDAQAIAPLLDAFIAVVEYGRTTSGELTRGLQSINCKSSLTLGVVINKAER